MVLAVLCIVHSAVGKDRCEIRQQGQRDHLKPGDRRRSCHTGNRYSSGELPEITPRNLSSHPHIWRDPAGSPRDDMSQSAHSFSGMSRFRAVW